MQETGKPSILRDRENGLESQDRVNSGEPLLADHRAGLQLVDNEELSRT